MQLESMPALAGLLVGAMVGVTGVGGGSLMTPILVMLFGVAPTTAVGTDLLYASITKMFGVGVHHGHGTVDWQVVRRLALGSLPAAALTLAWMHFSEAALDRMSCPIGLPGLSGKEPGVIAVSVVAQLLLATAYAENE